MSRDPENQIWILTTTVSKMSWQQLCQKCDGIKLLSHNSYLIVLHIFLLFFILSDIRYVLK